MATTTNTNHNTFAIRLHEARLMMKFSMDKLAEQTGYMVTKQSISKYEKGIMKPKHDSIMALAKALNISEDYLRGKGVALNSPSFRSPLEGKMTEDEIVALESRLSYWTEQYLDMERKTGLGNVFHNPIDGFVVRTKEDAMKAADLLREGWHCGNGAIPSILRLMERKGIKIMSADLPKGILGLCSWADAIHPLVVVDLNSGDTVERLRFTLAHELAHLLLTLPADSDYNVEKRCNLFASFFLLPKSTFIEELCAAKRNIITLAELIDIKEQYGISLQALIILAANYGIITKEYKHWWYDEYLTPNPMETGLGHYPYAETLGRKSRVESVFTNITSSAPYTLIDDSCEEYGMAAEEMRKYE